MAYREFYQRPETFVPDYSAVERGISNLFTGIAQRQQDKRDLAEKFNYELKGGYESDQKILTDMAKSVVDKVVRGGGKVDLETKKTMAQGKSFAETSELQRKRAEDLNKRIDDLGTRNTYYDPTSDYKLLQKVSDPEVNFQTRGAILDDIEKNVGSARNFKKEKYLSDFVKGRQRSYKKKTTGSEDATNTKYDQSTFWDDRTGKPGVTDEHAIDLLKSNEMLDQQYNLDLEDQLLDEIGKMRASGDEKTAWMKDKTDAEVQSELINNPSKNIFNKKSFGERKREMAKRDLTTHNAIDNEVSYTKKGSTGNGNITNDSLGHSETFFNDKTGPSGSSVSGPGGLLMQKKGLSAGKPIQIDADSGRAFDYRTGKNANRSKGKFNLTGYQLMPYTKDGNLYPVQGNTFEEILASIKNLPDEAYRTLDPEMKIALNGYEINDSKMLGDIATKSFDIAEQIGDETDPEKKAELQFQLDELNRVKQAFNTPGMYDDDIIQAAQKSGIKGVRKDQLLMADRSDMDKIKTISGLDLKNKDQWTPEMKQLSDEYTKRWNQVNKIPVPTSDTESGLELKKKKKSYPLPPGKPSVVKQGEFTYTWNPATGQYE